MKRILTTMAAIAALTMISCEKEQLSESEISATGNDVITASTEKGHTRTSLSGNDSEGYDVVWSEGDNISLGGKTFTLIAGAGTTNGTFRGTLPQDGTYTASYNGSADNWPTFWMHSEDRIIGTPMTSDEVTISGGKLSEPLNFKNAGGILRLTLKGTATVREIIVYTDKQVNLRCGGGITLDNTNGKVFHLPLPAGSFKAPLIQIFTIDGLDIRKQMKSDKKLVIERSKITTLSLSGINSTAPAGILPGEFSVAEGSQVHFSSGNLRYTVDSQKWSFFDRQYHCGPKYYDDGHNKEISLFTWGYSSTKSIIPNGSDGFNVSIRRGNLAQNQDWGSQIGELGTWRTLTMSEWEYLFTIRTDAQKKYGFGTVGGVKGLIILPDKWTDPLTNGGKNGFKPQSSTSHWDDNVYTSGGNWEAMEYAGAVFFPTTGDRSGSTVSFFDSFAWYWSSTAEDMDHESADDKPAAVGRAFSMFFGSYGNNIGSGDFLPVHPWSRSTGCAVRLVTGTYTITFDLNGQSGTAPKSIGNLLYGSHIAKPASPTAEGYVFTGWYKEPECRSQWNFDSDPVTANTTLYAGWTDALLSGKFTVAEGRQVYFSKGNLWADGSNELHFEENQWGFNSSYSSSHVSHFTWSSSVDGAVGTSGSGNYLFCDKNHQVSVNGSAPLYYALTADEWKYLFYTDDGKPSRIMKYDRPTHSCNIRYENMTGLVIYPDDYNGEILHPGEDYTEENFPKCCVFLPGAGWRDGKTVRPVGNWNGFYWSSSAKNTQPYNLEFVSDGVNISEPGSQASAMSIRLVADVK